jgi:AraC-like DNA-binding protein
MNSEPESLLADYTVLRTDHVEPFHAYISGVEDRVERRFPGLGPTQIELRQAWLSQIDIVVFYCNAVMTVEADRKTSADFLIQFALQGGFDVDIAGQPIFVTRDRGAIICPQQHVQRTAKPGWTLVFRVPAELMRARLETRLGHSLTGRLEFQPLLDASAEELRNYCLLVVTAIDQGLAPRDSHVAKVLENGFLDLLLDLQPHTYGESLSRSKAESRQDRVRIVSQLLARHYREPLSVEQLADAAGCSVRTLQTTFTDLCGLSPMDYVRRYRLSRARELLEANQPPATISEIASRTGFTHVARFASCYRARYGESPSETRRRVANSSKTNR